jgi:hypothetical protein
MLKLRSNERGFLLIVVIGLLAVLLTVCIGFLSYTRGEVGSVASLRDKNDTMDIMHSALDWTLANMSNDLFASDKFNPNTPVSLANDGNNWWYRPYEMGLRTATPQWNWSGWPSTPLPYIDPNHTEAPWVYLPPDFFPMGGVRGRFAVQVIDLNCMINLNDWNEDCNPTQCEMAHMVIGAMGEHDHEQLRGYRDSGKRQGNIAPFRYQEGWRLATHTTRFPDWSYFYSPRVDNVVSDNWVTANSSWMGLFEPDIGCLRALLATDGVPLGGRVPTTVPWNTIPGSPYYYPVDPPNGWKGGLGLAGYPSTNPWSVGNIGMYIDGFTLQSHVDPDTGRSPVNVNTCYNSGELLPYYVYPGQGTFTMEGVFNVDSLRRIIKVGKFFNKAGLEVDLQDSAVYAGLTPADKEIAWELATKLAFQYQETMCRYFTGTYAHNNGRKYPPFKSATVGTYASSYGGGVSHGCSVTDYSATRFKTDVTTFRKWVHDDLITMTASNTNGAYTGTNPPPTNTSMSVGFDKNGNPQIAQGKLDLRTACAIYDNIIPGKPADITDFAGCTPYGLGDPLWELASMGVGRQEDIDDPTNVHGFWPDNGVLTEVSSYTGFPAEYPAATPQNMKDHNGGDLTVFPKGLDICETTQVNGNSIFGPWSDKVVTHVPFRQRAFSPDCFSTELTTTSTAYMLIINAELVDAATVSANPTDPTKHRDLFWNQWGAVVELAPDVMAESEISGGATGAPSEFHYYQRGFPRLRKTDPWWMDNADTGLTAAPPLATAGKLPADTGLPWGYSNAQYAAPPATATYTFPNPHTPIPFVGAAMVSSSVPNPSYSGFCPTLLARNLGSGGDRFSINPTAINTCDWQRDIHGIPAPAAAGGSQIRIPQSPVGTLYDESNFYAGTNPTHRQTTKRVMIRSIWALNQGLMR